MTWSVTALSAGPPPGGGWRVTGLASAVTGAALRITDLSASVTGGNWRVISLSATVAAGAVRYTALNATVTQPSGPTSWHVVALSAVVTVPDAGAVWLYPDLTVYPDSTLYPGVQDTTTGDVVDNPTPVAPPVVIDLASDVVVTATMPVWSAFSRAGDYSLQVALPIISAQGVRRHMGIGAAVLTTPFTPDAWDSLGPANGIVLYRNGSQEFAGLVSARSLDWSRSNGLATIKVEAVGDEQSLADRLVMPDPLRAADDQTVNDYWTATGPASTAMVQLINDQAGSSCASDRRITGLVVGSDPAAGVIRTWSGLFNSAGPNGVLDQLAAISASSGANLGLRMTTTAGALRATITQPRDLSATVRFSADLRNLVAISYREQAPTVTRALVAGQGDLHARTRKLTTTTDPVALSWARQVWSYVDRRDTADADTLVAAGTDALAQGAPTVSLVVTLTDSQAATYGADWDLGDQVTVYVGLPGQTKVATVSDVVREISFTVTETGAETLVPAIGSYDAKAVVPTPTQQQLADAAAALGGLISRK